MYNRPALTPDTSRATQTRSRRPGSEQGERPLRRGEILGIFGAAVLFLSICLFVIYQGFPLGHDEAVYATRAREILNGEPTSSWWAGNRAPGLPLILSLAWLGNATEPYLRLVVALSGVLLIVVTWLMARLMAGSTAALVAAFGVALSPVVLMSSTQVWPDVPGAAVGMAAICVYAYGLASERFRWWLVLAVVFLVAAATIIRYGAPVPIGIGLVGVTVWRWPSSRAGRLGILATAVGVGAVLATVLMTPLLTGAGSPLSGISARSANNPLFGGFADYWSLRREVLVGSTAVAFLGLLLGIVGSTVDRGVRRAFSAPFLLFALTFGALATVVHGEVRYLSPAIPWLWIAAGVGFVWAASRLPRSATVILVTLGVVFLAVTSPELADDAMEANRGFKHLETAASSLQSEGECAVLTSYAPQVEWYSGCETRTINLDQVQLESPTFPEDVPIYFFIVEDGKRQPSPALMEQYLAGTTGTSVMFGDPADHARYVQIWEVSDEG